MADVADLFRRLTTGVYVIGVAQGEQRNAFTAAWLTQVSFDPLLLALSVNPEHFSYPLLIGGGGFVINVLRRDQIGLAEAFGTRSGGDEDKLAGVAWRPAPSGAPILAEALAWLECRLHQRVSAGDHEIVLGRPVAGEIVSASAAPLLYPDTGELDGSRSLYPRALG
ncbi:MAG TPA: flavin reductase family protein [Gemmatimonadales bacterium]|jgi:flavin reductase (DIM6/NTAB) family NADH-FMN oxidoreductase RutF